MPRSVFACLECLERCRKPFYNLEEACFTLFKSAKCLKESLFSIEGFFQGISERREPFCELSSVLHKIQFFLWIKQCEFYRNLYTLFYIVLYMHQTLLYVINKIHYISDAFRPYQASNAKIFIHIERYSAHIQYR